MAEWVLFAVGVTIAGVALWPEYIADCALAFIFASSTSRSQQCAG
jgi:integral membrane sensor domain MASE1